LRPFNPFGEKAKMEASNPEETLSESFHLLREHVENVSGLKRGEPPFCGSHHERVLFDNGLHPLCKTAREIIEELLKREEPPFEIKEALLVAGDKLKKIFRLRHHHLGSGRRGRRTHIGNKIR